MATHMKTTIDLNDSLLIEAKQLAADEATTIKALVEAGLRLVLAERRVQTEPFRLRAASYRGKGLRPELQAAGWDRLRELAYEGGGG